MGFLTNLFKLGLAVVATAIARQLQPEQGSPGIFRAIHVKFFTDENDVERTEVQYQKNEEFYIFKFKNEDTHIFKQTLGRYVSDPELDFDWTDAELIAMRVPNVCEEH